MSSHTRRSRALHRTEQAKSEDDEVEVGTLTTALASIVLGGGPRQAEGQGISLAVVNTHLGGVGSACVATVLNRTMSQTAKKAHVTTTPLNALANLRDLGGLPTIAGGRTRSGVLYRSALPIADDELPTTVPEWPVRTVIDLRSPKEQAVTEHPLLAEGTGIHRVSLLTDADVAGQHLRSTLDGIYSGILTNAGRQLAQILQIAAIAPAPLLLHCAAGKDRTGIATAMLLHAAGVDTADIVNDYAATDQHMGAVLARILRADPEFAHSNMYDNDLARAVPETISRVLDRWDSYPGGIHNWLIDNGADADAITQWTHRLVTTTL